MKSLTYQLFIFLILTFVTAELNAGTISGNVYYTGSSEGKIIIAVFTDPGLQDQPVKVGQIDAPGSYSITDLADGTYYIISMMGMSSQGEIEPTDPWGIYGTSEGLSPVTISGGAEVSGIDITLADGTEEHPNPFANTYISPARTIQLPETTAGGGSNPSIFTDGTSIYLYKHDNEGSGSAKIYKIDPSSEQITDTYSISLSSSPNGTSWIDELTYLNGILWASGGYGDPSGAGGVPGIFRFDMSGSSSSFQLPADTAINLGRWLTSDGQNLYASVLLENGYGIVKFIPDQVSEISPSLFIALDIPVESLCYGDGYLWAGISKLHRVDPANGNILEDYNIPPWAAEVYLNNMLWCYDEDKNVLEAYSLEAAGVDNENENRLLSSYSLSQNYPNPFNPSTVISYQVPEEGMVTLKIYDILGNEVKTLVEENKSVGSYKVNFDASELAGGVYIYRLTAGAFSSSKKMLLIK